MTLVDKVIVGCKPQSAVFLVAAPVFDVGVLVRNVDVAAQNKFALGFQLHQFGVQFGQKAVFGRLALFARAAAGKVAADDGQLARRRVKAQLCIPAFGVKFGGREANHHVAGLVPGIDADPRVALFLCKLEIAAHVVDDFELVEHIRLLRLDFLHTNTIGPGRFNPGNHSLGGGRADTVEVEAG